MPDLLPPPAPPDAIPPPERGRNLTAEQVAELRRTGPARGVVVAARALGIARRTARRILAGELWRDGPWSDPEPPKREPGTRYTAAEDRMLVASPDTPAAELAALTGGSAGAVRTRRHRLQRQGAMAYRRPRWSAAEDEVIRTNAALPGRELAALLPGRSRGAVTARRAALGLGPGQGRPGLGMPRPPKRLTLRRWSPEEDAAIVAEPNTSARELAARLGRTVGAVHRRRSVLCKRHGGHDARTSRTGRGRR